MTAKDIPSVIRILRSEVKKLKTPYVTEVAEAKDPFRVLVSCIISLRTKDETTRQASERLFALAVTLDAVNRLDEPTIERTIYPAGFYRTKARTIKEIARALIAEYRGRVPDEIDELLKLKGVGRKTANLVVTMGYGRPGICVDTHVHRITNRWGFVSTKTPEETEFVLREKLPKRYWIEINDLLVAYGQNVCAPVSPFCSRCRLNGMCPGRGVGKSR